MSDSALSGATVEPIVAETARMTLKDDAMVGPSSDVSDMQSDVSGSQAIQTMGGPESDQCVANANVPSSKMTTKVYYNIDDEATPYCTEVPVPPDRITLRDFKNAFNRQQNFKYYCKRIDRELGKEVKSELRDDSQPLERSQNDIFELFLLTAEGSTHSDGSSGAHPRASMRNAHMVPAPAPSGKVFDAYNAQYMHGRHFDQSHMSTDSESVFGTAPQPFGYPRASLNRRPPQYYQPGHRGRRFEESTIASESDARIFSDDDDQTRVSTSTDITSVSRQQQNLYRRRKNRRKYRQPSRASSFTSITESSMSLDVITVTLNMDTVNFLGISIVGQSSQRGDTGIYVANIMKGGAVALDGRIEAGDMILQVNDVSFENFTNDQAVDVLREAVARRGPIKLTVAKCWESGQKSCFTVPRPRDEPVRPIDTQAWIQHTNAMRGMPSILEGSEGAPTPVPGQYPPHNRPPSSSTVTSGGSGPNTVIGGGPTHLRLDTKTDKRKVVEAMAMPNSGLDIRDRTWLKIPIRMCFLGTDLVNWLLEHVDGLKDNKEAKKYAMELLQMKLIMHVVKKVTFTEQCYYQLGEEFERHRLMTGECSSGRSDVGSLPPPPAGFLQSQPQQATRWQMIPGTNGVPSAPSMVSGYAQMPPPSSTYSYNPLLISHQRTGAPDVNSQASGHSNEGSSGSEHRRMARAVLPPAPSISSSQPPLIPIGSSTTVSLNPPQHRLDELPTDLASSRQSFRIAMNQPFEFFVDNL
ncbi:hypothetical protein QR680_001423 [Steinernema hermaphroditum]|uniref:PDZ domain-containing protein n=1 Tax=Steinernema hermaphroditum TaxID=289476 RepID=A0AA39LFW8_9BILA|nr:hypothetical protein QR680_001423 [Steinernema hermaphroditum]